MISEGHNRKSAKNNGLYLPMTCELVVFILSFLLLLSCSQVKNRRESDKGFRRGVGDLQYLIHADREGDAIEIGDFVSLYAIEKTEKDSILYSSYECDNRATLLPREKAYFKGDFNSALGMLSEGDSATFMISKDSLIQTGREELKKYKGQYLIFTVKIDRVIHRGNLSDSLLNIEIENFIEAERNKARDMEQGKLEKYISSLKPKPDVTPLGASYLVNMKGNGPKAKMGDTVIVSYTAKYLSGKIFDSSVEETAKRAGIFKSFKTYGPLRLTVEKKPLSAFDEAMLLFPQGTKVTLIIPSQLAYGADGGGGVKGFTPVICEMEIVAVINSKNKQASF